MTLENFENRRGKSWLGVVLLWMMALTPVAAIAAGAYYNLALVRRGLATPSFQISGTRRYNGACSLQVPTVRGKSYFLQYHDVLDDSRWTPLPPVPGDGAMKTLSDSQPAPRRFYRVWQKP
jgi:hypothetical protein